MKFTLALHQPLRMSIPFSMLDHGMAHYPGKTVMSERTVFDMSEDKLTMLLQRAIDDDGPEGVVAFNMFRKKVKGQTGQLFFLLDDYSNPAAAIIKSKNAEIIALKLQKSDLQAKIEKLVDRMANIRRDMMRLLK